MQRHVSDRQLVGPAGQCGQPSSGLCGDACGWDGWRGEVQEGGDIRVHRADSLPRTPPIPHLKKSSSLL